MNTIEITVKNSSGYLCRFVDRRVWKAWQRFIPGTRTKWLEDRGTGSMSVSELRDMQEAFPTKSHVRTRF